MIPTGIPVAVALVGAISAAGVHPGTPFHFKTVSEVRAGTLDIPAGTPGSGIVAAATPGSHGFRTSTLTLAPQSLQLASGTTIGVTAAPDSPALTQTRRPHIIPIPFFVGGTFVLGGLGTAARSASLADGTRFTVVTTGR